MSARSPTTLLFLPDDLLYLIFEEVHEDRHEEIATRGALQIAEILINKRIFDVARPLWFSRLSITTPQLDRRLSGILRQDDRRLSLRRLEIPLTSTFADLTELAVTRLTGLTHFSVTCGDRQDQSLDDILVRIVESMSTLRHLRTSVARECHAAPPPQPLEHRLRYAVPSSFRSWRYHISGRLCWAFSFRGNGVAAGWHFAQTPIESYHDIKGSRLEYGTFGPPLDRKLAPVQALLESLAAALTDNDVGRARFSSFDSYADPASGSVERGDPSDTTSSARSRPWKQHGMGFETGRQI